VTRAPATVVASSMPAQVDDVDNSGRAWPSIDLETKRICIEDRWGDIQGDMVRIARTNVIHGTDNKGWRHSGNYSGHNNGSNDSNNNKNTTSGGNTSNTSGNGVPAVGPNFNIT
jgi:hypothetical protein